MVEITAPQRLPPAPGAVLGPRVLESIERLRVLSNYDGPPIHDFYLTLTRSPEVLASYLQLGIDLGTEITLPSRERELAILRTGWLCGAPYQWGEHVITARRSGLGDAEFERVREGSQASGWSESERALLVAVEELHEDAMISDATWARLAAHFDARQVIELVVVVGHYHTTAFVQNALRIPLNANNPGLLSGQEAKR